MDSNKPLSWQNILAGVIATVVGGVILAIILQDARFAPSPASSDVVGESATVEAQLSGEKACRQWSITTDFQIWPRQENPNRDSCGSLNVWHFMSSDRLARIPETYYLLPEFIENAYKIKGLLRWQNLNASYAGIGFNATAEKQQIQTVSWPVSTVVIHPDTSRLIIVGWRSPITDNIDITGGVADAEAGCGNGVNWYISKGTEEIAAGAIDKGGVQEFQNGSTGKNLSSVYIQQGEFIYLAIDPKGDDTCDGTLVRFIISR